MGFRAWALAAALASIAAPLAMRLPHPYDAVAAMPIDGERVERMARGAPTFAAPYRANERLARAERLFEGRVLGAESVAVTPDGELLMLDREGWLHRARKMAAGGDYELEERAAYSGPGRPLGFHVVEEGSALLVCDSLKGLVRLDLRTGQMAVLANRDGAGQPINYANGPPPPSPCAGAGPPPSCRPGRGGGGRLGVLHLLDRAAGGPVVGQGPL